MKTYLIHKSTFLSVKSILDQLIFWRVIDKDTIEVKPVFKYAEQLLENITNPSKGITLIKK